MVSASGLIRAIRGKLSGIYHPLYGPMILPGIPLAIPVFRFLPVLSYLCSVFRPLFIPL